ncbi:MAG: hypothetical protein KAY82_06005 [Hylemonella sp.]|nr:hypothetical protein [Hylemonella sp.]
MKLTGLATPHDMVDAARTEDKSTVKPGLLINPDLPEPTVSAILAKSPPSAGGFVYEDPQKVLVHEMASQNLQIESALSPEKRASEALLNYAYFQTLHKTAPEIPCSVYAAIHGPPAHAEPDPTLICPTCHADRLKEDCRGDPRQCTLEKTRAADVAMLMPFKKA